MAGPFTKTARSPVDETREALDRKREETKQAWDTFDAAREELVKSDVDLSKPSPELTRLGELEATYRKLADEQEVLVEQWETSLKVFGAGVRQNGNGNGGPDVKAPLRRHDMPEGAFSKAVLGQLSAKALVTPAGAVLVPDVLPIIVDQPVTDLNVLGLFSRRQTTGDEVRYLATTVETPAAAAVSPGGTKPTSVYTTTPKSSPITTIATISEPLDRSTLMDFELFGPWLEGRLRQAVSEELQEQVLKGNGTAPNLRGVLNTAGITAITATTGQSMIDVIASAIAALADDGVTATGIALSVSDFWKVRVSRETAGPPAAGAYLMGAPSQGGAATLFGLPVTVSRALLPDEGIVADFRQGVIVDRESTTILWSDSHSTLFQTNQLIVRCELRAGFYVSRPQAFAKVDFTV